MNIKQMLTAIAAKLVTVAQKVPLVYEAGKLAEYNRFWDANQNNGNRVNYRYGYYGLGWTDDNFHPKHIFKPTVAYGMFQSCRATVFDALLDMSQVTDGTSMFNGARFLELPEIDMTDATYSKAAMFAGSGVRKLVIRVSANTTYAKDMFNLTSGLYELIIIGIIGQNGLDVHWSTKLDKESHVNVVGCISTTASITVTFSKVAVNKAFETAPGANDGSTSQEWNDLVDTRPNATIVLA